MKQFYTILITAICLGNSPSAFSQTGPNLLGAKGTFSAPFITVNQNATSCTSDGTHTYSPIGNVGNALEGCSQAGTSLPCSGYDYVYKNGGLQPEFTYTILKTIGDSTGGNCIKGDWRGQDHTGGDSYFMAVNGAPNNSKSPIFYQMRSIPVCPGTKYEFSAWVINMLPASSNAAHPGSEPNISFKVITNTGEQIIGNSGPIAYTNTPTWVKVGGTFTASPTTTSVDLQVINATAVASGNDLGLDDISFNVVKSNIAITGPNGGEPMGATCGGTSFSVNYVVTDPTQTNTWYKWQISTDGGATFVDSSLGAQTATYTGNSFTLPFAFNNVTTEMSGHKYKLIVSASEAGLSSPSCTYQNEYTLIVNACGSTPVTLTTFNGRFSDGSVYLNWETSQEANSDYFEIYKSTDGQSFSPIAKIQSAGFSNQVKKYAYIDHAPGSSPFVYYRLKQVDADGKYVFSTIVKISLGTKATIEVFPNPFTHSFTASFSANKTENATLVLRNSVGQPVYKKIVNVNKGNNSITINNLPSLTTGIYYLIISNNDIKYISKLQK